MSYEHHQMAHLATARMLDDLRGGSATWAISERPTPRTTYWQGVADWPRPDQAFQDETTGSSLAIEFKPPGHDKGEYVRGLGQALTYLEKFEFSALVVPRRARDGFEIGGYLSTLLEHRVESPVPIAVLEYEQDPAAFTPRLSLRLRSGSPPPIPRRDRRTRGVFWAYWRDLSQFELFQLLLLMDRYGTGFDASFNRFWKQYRSKGRSLTWENTKRRATTSAAYCKSERANSGLSLRHTGLIGADGRMTDAAYELLRHGKVYSPKSLSFRSLLGRLILTTGRHLELIFWIEEKQRELPQEAKGRSRGFLTALDKELAKAGVIVKAPTGRAKATFIRDEPKLWNKLGLLMRRRNQSYFFPGEGFRFDWRACVDMVNYGQPAVGNQ